MHVKKVSHNVDSNLCGFRYWWVRWK